jgi:hypothetical protein
MAFDFSKLFSKGLDPTSLLFGGLSLLGGDPGPQRMTSFVNPGHQTDPVQGLDTAIQAILRLGQGMTERPQTTTRSSYAPQGPGPITIPGIPFQIGGGFPHDPAIDNPSLLVAQDRGLGKYDPFQSLIPQKQQAVPSTPTPPSRRKPNG